MSKPEGPECYIPRLEKTMKEIPDKYHEFLWEYTGSGKSPASVQAAVCYIESSCSQSQAEDTFNISIPAIRDCVNEMIECGVINKEDITKTDSPAKTVPQFGEERTIKGGRKGGRITNQE